MANGCCRMHRGRALIGPAHPSYKHGAYSVAMRRIGLGDKYQAALADPNLLSRRKELAVMEARIAALLERLGSGESAGAWERAQKQLALLESSFADGAPAELGPLKETILQGVAGEQTWEELYGVAELQSKMAAAEARAMADLDQVLTVEQSKALAAAVFQAVVKNVLGFECTHCKRDARKVVSAVGRELMAIVDARREG